MGTGAWLNISVSKATLELMDVQHSALIKFEAVAFTLPVKDSIMKESMQQRNSTDFFCDPGIANTCNNHACVLSTAVEDEAYQDQVRLLPLCLTRAGSTEDDQDRFNNNRNVAET